LVYKSTLATGHSKFFYLLKKICGINNLESTTMENYLFGKLGGKKKGEEIPWNVSIIWVQQMNTHPAPAHNIMFVHGICFVSFGHLLFGVYFFSPNVVMSYPSC